MIDIYDGTKKIPKLPSGFLKYQLCKINTPTNHAQR